MKANSKNNGGMRSAMKEERNNTREIALREIQMNFMEVITSRKQIEGRK